MKIYPISYELNKFPSNKCFMRYGFSHTSNEIKNTFNLFYLKIVNISDHSYFLKLNCKKMFSHKFIKLTRKHEIL